MSKPRLVGLLVAMGLLASMPYAWSGLAAEAAAGSADTQARQRPTPSAATPAPLLAEPAARVLVDSLVGQVAVLRGLEAKRELQIRVASRDWVRQRLGELIELENIEPQAREEERVLKFLGLIPPDADLIELYKDLMEEQLAGMYDIESRVLVLADWLPPELQLPVVTHEVTHALQDQHFSLRVRKKLGFETPDAEAAWHALLEGDATAAMLEVSLQAMGVSFASLADSFAATSLAAILESAQNVGTQRLRAAPQAIRDAISFPYDRGLLFVTALYREGGWERVDQAYVQPPISTEQILHPERFLPEQQDVPIRVETPDVRGVLGAGYAPVARMPIGEFDLYLYLNEYVDSEIAEVAAEGWGGAHLTLYEAPDEEPDALIMVTTWDTDEDALEFFGSVIGVLDRRYPQQSGDLEATNANRITWNVDSEGRYQNVVRLVARHVQVLERVPVAVAERTLQKLDRMTQFEDPNPKVRARAKMFLPWNRKQTTASHDSALTLRVDLPRTWTVDPPDPDRIDLVASAQRNGAKMAVMIDRDARDRLGISGFAHQLAAQIQANGSDVYIQKDVGFPRDDALEMYEHVFTQVEGDTKVVYYIAVANLRRGYGYVVISQPDAAPSVESDFYELLDGIRPAPWAGPEDTGTQESSGDAPSGNGNDPRSG